MPEKIIVADDEEWIADTLKDHLLEWFGQGTVVDMVYDGNDLVDRVEQGDYSIVISDCEMEPTSGFTAVREIRSSNPKLPIYMMSFNEENESLAIDTGANGFIVKGEFDRVLPLYFQKFFPR